MHSRKELHLPFPAEHPYSSHISRFAVFPDTHPSSSVTKEGEGEGGRNGWQEGREEGREKVREGGREVGREGGRERGRGRMGENEGRREGGTQIVVGSGKGSVCKCKCLQQL